MNNFESVGAQMLSTIEKRLYELTLAQLEKADDIYEAEKIIRESKFSLTLKRLMLNEEKVVLEKRENEIDYKISFIKPVNIFGRRFAFKLKESLLSPFKYCINKVQNSLGSDVSSHFKFNSWVILHNLITFFFILLPFICIPHAIMIYEDHKYASLANHNISNQSIREENRFCEIKNSSLKFTALDFLVADNVLKFIFYGCFRSELLVSNLIAINFKLNYNIQYAYLLTMIVLFIYWLASIGAKLIKLVSIAYFQRSVSDGKTDLVKLAFVGWPFYTVDAKYIEKKRSQIYNNFLDRLDNEEINRTAIDYFILIILNITFFGLFAGFGVGIYYFINGNFFKLMDKKNKRLMLAGIINLFSYFSPIICNLFSHFERKRVTESHITLIKMVRMFSIQSITLALVIAFIIIKHEKCWENELGQQLYTIIIIDFLLFFIDLPIMFIYKLVRKWFEPEFENEFNTAYYTINIIFSQSLVWIGVYFSPFLMGLQFIKTLTIFLIRYFLVTKIYNPPKMRGSTSRNNSYFLSFTLIIYTIIMIGIGYINIDVSNSKTCGPFDDEKYSQPFDYIYKLRDELYGIRVLSIILKFLLSPGLLAFLLFLLSVLFYSSFSVMNGYKRRYKILRAMKIEKLHCLKDRVKRKKELEISLNLLDGTVETNDEDENDNTHHEPAELRRKINQNSNRLRVNPSSNELFVKVEHSTYALNRNFEIIELKNMVNNKNDISFDIDSIDQDTEYVNYCKPNTDYDADNDDLDEKDCQSDYVSEHGDDFRNDVAF